MSDYIPNTDKWWNSTNLTKDLAETIFHEYQTLGLLMKMVD